MTAGNKSKIIVVLGPNASGKSALAVFLAKKFNGEIISADSRQVYRGMDIGTGKVPNESSKFKVQSSKSQFKIKNDYLYKGIRHHLLDAANPKRRFTVAQYKRLATKVIKNIQKRGNLPIICGGTGFYIQAVADNISIPEIKPDLKLRRALEKKSAQKLFARLKKLDPNRAKNIDRFNKRRLVRALEIILKTGKPIARLKNQPQFNVLFIGVKKSPAELKKLIHTRLLKRLTQGMIKEVRNLRNSGLSWKRLDTFGLEYRWIARFLQKKVTRQEMISRLQKDIEHYAKRQMTWFKRDKRIRWIKNPGQAKKITFYFLKNKGRH